MLGEEREIVVEGEFPVKVRGSFCDDDEVPEAISQELIGEFKDYLQTYGF